ncbi:MAG: hypothetical protein J6S67_17275 [Methanobrevibacter sp.]|nr:hypothetical protein [Methanobrevibacter sp.]
MAKDSFFLDPDQMNGDTPTDLTNAVLREIKLRMSKNQFAQSLIVFFGSEVVEGIYHSFVTFALATNRKTRFMVDYVFENRDNGQFSDVTEVKVSLRL